MNQASFFCVVNDLHQHSHILASSSKMMNNYAPFGPSVTDYLCVSIPALQISSSVSFSRFHIYALI